MFENANMAVVKLTKGCNLRCKYCYIEGKDNYTGKIIEWNTFKSLVGRIIRDRQYSNNKKLQFVFHGGEPLMAGYEKLKKMLQYADWMFTINDLNVTFGIQSNLTLLDEKMIRLLNQYNIGVGASFDGFSNNATAQRLGFGKKSNILLDKIKMIKDNGGELGVLTVVTPNNYKTIIKDSVKLRKKYGLNGIKANRAENVIDESNDGEVMGYDLFKYVYKPLFEEFMNRKDFNNYELESNMRDMVMKYFLHKVSVIETLGRRSNCYTHFCGGGLNIVEVEPNGNVHFCGRYKKEYEESYIENILDKDAFNLNSFKRWSDRMLADYDSKIEAGCFGCEAFDICDGGCQAFYFSKFEKWGIRTDLTCDLFKNMYQLFEENVNELVLKVADYIMAVEPVENRITWVSGYTGSINIFHYYKKILGEKGYKLSLDNRRVKLEKLTKNGIPAGGTRYKQSPLNKTSENKTKVSKNESQKKKSLDSSGYNDHHDHFNGK